MRHAQLKATLAFCLVLSFATWLTAERFGYAPEEFTARRAKLAAALRAQAPEGTLILFGASTATPGLRFRQDHDFYYLTGNESLNAVFVMDVASGASHLFLPRLTRSQIQFDGGNWLSESGAAAQVRIRLGRGADVPEGFHVAPASRHVMGAAFGS